MSAMTRHTAWTGLFALAMCAPGAEPVDAQWFKGAGYVSGGITGTATSELDEQLAAQGYPNFGRRAVAISVGAYATVANRLILGGEWTGLIKGEQEHEGRTMWLGGGYGTLGVGYAVDVSSRVRVYPRLGVGAGGLGLSFESAEETVGFDEVLTDPDTEADLTRGFQPSLTRGYGVMDLGAGAEFLPARNGRGMLIGLRLGYVIAPSSTRWELNKRPVSGGPSASMAGPYIRLLIGAAGWR